MKIKNTIKVLKNISFSKAVFLLILILIYSFSSYIPIIFIERMIDSIDLPEASDALFKIFMSGIFYIIFQLFSQLFYALYNYYSEKQQNIYASKIRTDIFNTLLHSDELSLNRIDYSKLSSSTIQDTQYIADNYYKVIVKGIAATINFIIGFIFMSSISLYLSLIIIPLGLITSFCSNKIEKLTDKNLKNQKRITEKTWKLFGEGIRGIKTIKIFDLNNRYYSKVQKVSDELCETNITQSKIENLGSFVIGSLYMMTIALIMLFSSIFVVYKWISIGGLLALVMYNHMLVDPLLNLIETKQQMMKLNISISRIENILSIAKVNRQHSDIEIDQVEIKHVSFSYENKEIFKDFSLELNKGHKYCIVGETGKGKSTLLNLITGYLKPAKGKIVYKNRNTEISNIIPNRVAYMTQAGYLFNKTIDENIRFANPSIDEQKLALIKSDCCLNEVCQRVKGAIGDDGMLLSGGERKRVQLAICLAKQNSDILLFDEPSSSLDELTYEKIIKNLDKYSKDKIVIFIDHRNKFSGYYDEIVEL